MGCGRQGVPAADCGVSGAVPAHAFHGGGWARRALCDSGGMPGRERFGTMGTCLGRVLRGVHRVGPKFDQPGDLVRARAPKARTWTLLRFWPRCQSWRSRPGPPRPGRDLQNRLCGETSAPEERNVITIRALRAHFRPKLRLIGNRAGTWAIPRIGTLARSPSATPPGHTQPRPPAQGATAIRADARIRPKSARSAQTTPTPKSERLLAAMLSDLPPAREVWASHGRPSRSRCLAVIGGREAESHNGPPPRRKKCRTPMLVLCFARRCMSTSLTLDVASHLRDCKIA